VTQIYNRLKRSPKYTFFRVVSTRLEACNGKAEIDPNHEVSLTEEEFQRAKDANKFMYCWTEARGKDTPIQWAIPASLSNALGDGKKVLLVIPSIHRSVASDIEKILSLAFPVKVLAITTTATTILSRIRANPKLLFTSPALGIPVTATTESLSGDNAPSSARPGSSQAGSTSTSSGAAAAAASSASQANDQFQALIYASLQTLSGSKLEEKIGAAKKRLTKLMSEAEPFASAPGVVHINNENSIDSAVEEMLSVIGFDPENDFKVEPTVSTGLQDCPAQEYLQKTVYGALFPALRALSVMRPADPVEYLALTLLKQSQSTSVQQQQLERIRSVEAALRVQYTLEQREAEETGRL